MVQQKGGQTMNEQQIKDYLNKELQRISFNAEKSFLEHDYSLYNKYGIQEQLLTNNNGGFIMTIYVRQDNPTNNKIGIYRKYQRKVRNDALGEYVLINNMKAYIYDTGYVKFFLPRQK